MVDSVERIADEIEQSHVAEYLSRAEEWTKRLRALSAPEASGADHVLVPREPAEAMTDAGDLARVAHFGTAAEIYAAMIAAAPINPAPPTSGLERIDGMEFYLHEDPDSDHEVEPVRLVMAMSHNNKVFCHRESQGDNGVCKPTPADESEPRAAGQEGVNRSILGGLIEAARCLGVAQAGGGGTAAYWEQQISEYRARLQPSGAAEDAARYAWLKQWDIGINSQGFGDYYWYAYAKPDPHNGKLSLDAAIDAARRARGESNG